MTTQVTVHPWSPEALYEKARLFVSRMEETPPEDDRHGLWSALALELLARAALAYLSPALLANRNDWRNTAYALDLPIAAKKFTPSSVITKDVLVALNELIPTFTQEMAGFCTEHMAHRNEELHTGGTFFGGTGNTKWLPRFYQVCTVLLESMRKSSQDFFSKDTDVTSIIENFANEAAKKVKGTVNAHKTIWNEKSDEERAKALAQSTAWATRHNGHRATCPACGNTGLIQGTSCSPPRVTVEDENVIERQTMVPEMFQCIACNLRIQGHAKLNACGLGDFFTATTRYTVADYYGLYTEDDMDAARGEYPEEEPDFNDY